MTDLKKAAELRDIDRTLAERVMGWRLARGDGSAHETIPYWVGDGAPLGPECNWNPSTSEADFAECFAKASDDVQTGAVCNWLDERKVTGYDCIMATVIAWQLAPLAEKARALAVAAKEASSARTQEDK